MYPITLTTTIRNSATLPLLLKMTDELHEKGLLTTLRVVDATSNFAEKAEIRSNIPMDGVSKTKSVMVDFSTVKMRDSKARISTGLTGYHYRTTDLKIVRGGKPITIAVRSSHGANVWASQGVRGRTGVELVLGLTSCFFRYGKGGGNKVDEINVSGSLYEGAGWRAVELCINSEGKLIAKLDTNDQLTCEIDSNFSELEINVSSSPSGIADIIVTSLDMHDLGAKSDRSYAYYYSNVPEKVSEGFELFSQNDIVYIDLDNWSSLLYESVPLVVGDAAHLSALRRAGLFNRYDVDGLHKSFLDRSFMCIERTRRLASQKIALMTSDNSSVIINNSKNSSFGVPVLICVLDSKSALDSNIIDGYSSLLKFGPVGEELTPSAEDVIAYLDSIIEDPKFEFFLLEFIERLDSTRRARLLELLSR